jgi:SAM-dependent methyltransferase
MTGSKTMDEKMSINKKALNSFFDDAIDELEITYDAYFEIELYRPRCVHTVNRLLSSGIRDGKVMVLGSNEKPFSMLLEKLGYQVESFSLPLNYHKEGACETAFAIIQKIRNSQSEYDIIICDDILQHLPSPADTLSVMKDHVRPGGVLTVTTPNIARGTSRLRLLTGRNVYPFPNESLETNTQRLMPYREYTLRELELLVRNGGFELIQKEFIIGTYVNANRWPPMPVKEYFLQKLFLFVQKIVAPFRNYLFVTGRRPL